MIKILDAFSPDSMKQHMEMEIDVDKNKENKSQEELLLEKIETLQKNLSTTTYMLEREQEWKDYLNPSFIPQHEYRNIQSMCLHKFVEAEDVAKIKTFIHNRFGFDAELVTVLASIPAQEINRHGQIRTIEGKSHDRRPLYRTETENYILFKCCGYTYECIDGVLHMRTN